MAAKNRKLFERIKEQDRLVDEFSRMAHAQVSSAAADAGGEMDPDAASIAEVALLYNIPTPLSAELKEQCLLVVRLRKYLLAEERLACSEITRDELITALGTNRTTLNEAVRNVTGKATMEFMRTLKIDEARKQLDLHPEQTVESVAYSCGFNIPSSFYRMFRKQYGISPTEYRKQAKAQVKQ